MTSDWLPVPAAWVLSVVFVAVAAVHLRHLLHTDLHTGLQADGRRSGQAHASVRVWHGGHVAMAVGMVLMLLPIGLMPPAAVAVPAFAALGALSAATCAAAWLRARRSRTLAGRAGGRRWAWCWAVLAVDMAVMAYMWTVTSATPAWLTVTAVVWLAAESVLWGAGVLPGRASTPRGEVEARGVVDLRDAEVDGEGARQPVSAGTLRRSDGGLARGTDQAVRVSRGGGGNDRVTTAHTAGGPAARAVSTAQAAHLLVAHPGLRVTMAVMALGMAYMLLSMQFGHMPMGSGMEHHHH